MSKNENDFKNGKSINNILLISNPKISEYYNDILSILKEEGHIIMEAYTAKKGIRWAETNNFELVVIEGDMPDMGGVHICKAVKDDPDVLSFIMFLNNKSSVNNIVEGLEAGADDYLPLPFDKREFIARVNALIRRMRVNQEILKIDDLVINTATRIVKRGDMLIDLTAREYALLEFLLRSKGKRLSRKEIAENVWGIDFDTGTNVIDVYIKYLREKLNIDGKKPQLIHTVYGYGYVMKITEEQLTA